MVFQRLGFAKLIESPKVTTLCGVSSCSKWSTARRGELYKSTDRNSGLFGVREAGGVGETSTLLKNTPVQHLLQNDSLFQASKEYYRDFNKLVGLISFSPDLTAPLFNRNLQYQENTTYVSQPAPKKRLFPHPVPCCQTQWNQHRHKRVYTTLRVHVKLKARRKFDFQIDKWRAYIYSCVCNKEHICVLAHWAVACESLTNLARRGTAILLP